ncbi:hypothetical protein LPTSP4_31270 [Leptospira ryugenii]|uniref:Uncharacterized protein n=1 Tax=Leptospira ryugenii TaxID=1917863 RepID=A0A2P2E3Y6_9LEPT|nr:hypothetical protein [Leptospira ryugenii]GBF51589.1 hypothetical protein LPTSP4_31270 [Leptospira ryugenii]
MADTYTKYFNVEFDPFDMDHILQERKDSTGFFLATVFQKRFSEEVNLKRHEDLKLWMQSKNLRYIVLDGIQKLPDDSGKLEPVSILYLLTFFEDTKITEVGFEDTCHILMKRYDLPSLIVKLADSDHLEIWNKDGVRKEYKQVSHSSLDSLLKAVFASINKKDHFQFVGIERSQSDKKSGYFATRRGFVRAIA